MYIICVGDVDNVVWFVVFDFEVWGCFMYEVEGCGVVQSNDGVLLFVCYFVDYFVLGVVGVVDDDMDFVVVECGGFFDEVLDVGFVGDIVSNGESIVRSCGVDVGGYVCGFFCMGVSYVLLNEWY